MTDKTDHFEDLYSITARELAALTKGCQMLPGKWIVQPEIDHCRVGAPRVWLRPDVTQNSFSMSFGFTKEDGQCYVTVQQHSNRGECALAGMPFGTLDQALAMCRGSVLIYMKHAILGAMKQAVRDANGGHDCDSRRW
jgi:hypothetical protein